MRTMICVMAGLALSGSALAQNGGFQLTDGTAVYDVSSTGAAGSIPTTTEPSGTAVQAQANFRANGAASTDHLYLNWWWYRVNGASTRELGVRQTTGTAVRTSSAANTVRYDITTTADLSFSLEYILTDLDGAAGEQANILMNFTVRNTSANALDVSLFNMADLFLAGQDASDRLRTATVGSNGDRSLLISDSANAAATMMFTGYGASGYGIGTFSGLSAQITDTGIDNFADINSGSPVEPAAGVDISAVMQWNLGLLGAGESRTVSSAIAVHTNGTAATVPAPASAALLGLGGLLAARRRRA
jgi:hypothetical protein